jgi:hypothetical protein
MKYELEFFVPEDDILHSHRRESLKSYKSVQVSQFKRLTDNRSSRETQEELVRIKGIEGESVEAKTSGMGHGSREFGRKTRSRRVEIECALKVM